MSGPTWLGVARLTACCLIGAPLTYAAFYAGLYHDAGTTGGRLPNLILIALSIILGGMLTAGLRWTRLLYPAGRRFDHGRDQRVCVVVIHVCRI